MITSGSYKFKSYKIDHFCPLETYFPMGTQILSTSSITNTNKVIRLHKRLCHLNMSTTIKIQNNDVVINLLQFKICNNVLLCEGCIFDKQNFIHFPSNSSNRAS